MIHSFIQWFISSFMQDYKSLCASVTMCATVAFHQLVWIAQPAKLKTRALDAYQSIYISSRFAFSYAVYFRPKIHVKKHETQTALCFFSFYISKSFCQVDLNCLCSRLTDGVAVVKLVAKNIAPSRRCCLDRSCVCCVTGLNKTRPKRTIFYCTAR